MDGSALEGDDIMIVMGVERSAGMECFCGDFGKRFVYISMIGWRDYVWICTLLILFIPVIGQVFDLRCYLLPPSLGFLLVDVRWDGCTSCWYRIAAALIDNRSHESPTALLRLMRI